jgi:SAM-dependent methyltransferase
MMNPAEFANIAKAERDFWWYRGMRRIMFRLLDPIARHGRIRDVLEAGCGTGHFALELQRRYGWRMFPLDLGREGLEYGRRLGAQRMTQGDVARLPFGDQSFDSVVSMDVIVHFGPGAEREAVREMARVARRGGLLVVRVSALNALRSRHSEFAGERQRFTRRRLIRAFEDAGVRVLRCTYANTLLLPVALAKFRLWEPLLRRPPASGVEPVAPWLDRVLYIPLAVESAWLGAGGRLPLGQSLVLIGEKPA